MALTLHVAWITNKLVSNTTVIQTVAETHVVFLLVAGTHAQQHVHDHLISVNMLYLEGLCLRALLCVVAFAWS